MSQAPNLHFARQLLTLAMFFSFDKNTKKLGNGQFPFTFIPVFKTLSIVILAPLYLKVILANLLKSFKIFRYLSTNKKQ